MKVKTLLIKAGAIVAATSIATTTQLTGAAAAATQFPSGAHDGMTVDWSGDWVNLNRLDNVTLQLCDASPKDKNKATARLQAYITKGNTWRIATAPAVFQVPIGDKKCWEWRKVFLTYFDDDEVLAYARVAFYGSTQSDSPLDWWWVKWVRNPFVGS
ncbi:hypothetical protein ACFQ1S_00280 [Kibdelosporangium lantanae]|uniref:Secreted protein n=1 Tax=Kibdelosporangium lantanae TaxID=1497396 RepID=A0ABW3M437_9PSEU